MTTLIVLQDVLGASVGHIWADGSLSLDPSWLQKNGLMASFSADSDAATPSILGDPVPSGSQRPIHTGSPPPVTVPVDVETFPADQRSGTIHTGAPSPPDTNGHTETFPADQDNGPAILEARAQPTIDRLPPSAGAPDGTQRYRIGGNTITLTPQPGGTYKAEVTINEDFGDVVRGSATKKAGADARAKGQNGDVGFHTIAHRFFPGLTETIVPGNGDLNGSDYRAMENRIAAGVARGETVTGTIDPLPEDSARPQLLSVDLVARDHAGNMLYPIGGNFPNKAP